MYNTTALTFTTRKINDDDGDVDIQDTTLWNIFLNDGNLINYKTLL